MIKQINNRIQSRVIIRLFLLFLMCVGMLFCTTLKAEAATTCKSVISYPGKTTASVNFRKKAGTQYKSYGMLSQNQSVTILGWVTNNGTKWYKCKAKVNGKTKNGYICASYIKKTSKPSGVVNQKVTSYLNVRKSAKTSAKVLIKIPKNTKVTVLGIKKVSGKYWYKVKVTYKKKTKTGYVLSTYIKVNSSDSNSSGTTGSTNTGTDTQKTLTGYVNEKVTTSLNVRSAASVKSAILLAIPRNTIVTILGTSGDWYNIKVTYNGKTVTGYASKTYITIKDSSSSSDTAQDSGDETFETLLKNFPDSYKSSLTALHKDYPNWKFVAVNTNLDWSTVIQNESVVGRNVIQSNYPRGTNSLAPFSYLSTEAGAYNWATDQYIVKDGTNWYSANSAVIAYYMDPRNFLNSTDIFQFEALAYDESQNINVIQSILSNTFMKGNYSVYDSSAKKTVTGAYKQAFMDAGKKAEANPYFLAARSKQEVGVNGSNATSGSYKGYEGIYNFYNIGAFDGGDAVAKGLQWAKGGASNATTYGRPWTNPYKSIVGGAQYIAQNYINKGQNTLYFQKFNVKPTDSSNLYLHQYMTNVQAPYSEGRTTRASYNAMGVLSDTMVFYIPVYNNMPSSACKLPAATGNPNPYLSSIKIYNGSTELSGLTPTFQYDKLEYTIVVPKSVSSVTVKATTVSSRASVSGTGTFNLTAGQTKSIKVVGKAENGTTKTYTIKVTRNTQ